VGGPGKKVSSGTRPRLSYGRLFHNPPAKLPGSQSVLPHDEAGTPPSAGLAVPRLRAL
jgi:hypothetical protein